MCTRVSKSSQPAADGVSGSSNQSSCSTGKPAILRGMTILVCQSVFIVGQVNRDRDNQATRAPYLCPAPLLPGVVNPLLNLGPWDNARTMSNQIQVQQVEADALPRLPNESQSSLKQPNDKDIQSTKNPTKMEKFKKTDLSCESGNWSVDLQAGSQYGYKLLSIVLLAGLGAILLQHKLWFRRGLLYPMYVMCEVGIIATDLAELLGSAIGLSLLIPAIPLWAGVLITSVDVIFVLAMAPTSSGRPVRAFEWLLMTLVLIVFVVFIILIRKIDPYWPDVFNGYLPSKTIFQPGALYTSIGILGATVMPHALFLGSSLATLDRVSHPPVVAATLPLDEQKRNYTFWQQFGRAKRALFWVQRSPASRSSIINSGTSPIEAATGLQIPDNADIQGVGRPAGQPSQGSPQFAARASDVNLNHEENKVEPQTQAHASPGRQNNSFNFIKAHLNHAIVDIGESISVSAPVTAHLDVSPGPGAAAFYYGGDGQILDAGLFDAHDLIRDKIGRPAAFLFALALLCSGQSASITATLTGQIVSEGFIEWRISVGCFFKSLMHASYIFANLAFGATDYHSVDWSSPFDGRCHCCGTSRNRRAFSGLASRSQHCSAICHIPPGLPRQLGCCYERAHTR
ncbi:Nramp domain-containing protein [Rhizoctonia solani AG-1 IA]|uniref:Nramp domain-containing protein n=1 Tax=Thanatephorus cucumeris (strain AG1-IA) TaxID=983506 RepID=L8X2F0_THACA|nr:Nramp domain-containing protein [Rhizoctonia solani AG-1 IA]